MKLQEMTEPSAFETRITYCPYCGRRHEEILLEFVDDKDLEVSFEERRKKLKELFDKHYPDTFEDREGVDGE